MNYCKIASKQMNSFIQKCFEANVNIRSLVIYQDNELLADIGISPYQSSDIQQVYSISKSFTTTAIGLLYDQGLIDLNKLVVDIFPEESPKDLSDFLRKMKVKHLLSMNTGHELDTTSRILLSSNPIAGFLSLPIEFEPGTHFTYNTGASYILSAIVTKITGKSLHDFLMEHLFHHLDIKNSYWGCDSYGIHLGGFDLHISNLDINKLGRLYLNEGVYNGMQLLSREWIKLATSNVSDTSIYDYSVDWKAGYGFQFWMNHEQGFRADGAYGQICLVDPSKKIVFSMLSETNNMQNEITLMKELLNDISVGSLHQDIVSNYYPPLSSTANKYLFCLKLISMLKPNQWTFQKIEISRQDKRIVLEFNHEGGAFQLVAGNGENIYNRFFAPRFVRKLFFDSIYPIEEQRCYASYMESDQRIMILLRYTHLPHTQFITITKQNDIIDFEWMSSFNFYGNDKTHIKGEILYE
jgi:CubicO group peptidase (beta-lactamase class C family)